MKKQIGIIAMLLFSISAFSQVTSVKVLEVKSNIKIGNSPRITAVSVSPDDSRSDAYLMTERAIKAYIDEHSGAVPNLQQVTNLGSTTTEGISLAFIRMFDAGNSRYGRIGLANNDFLFYPNEGGNANVFSFATTGGSPLYYYFPAYSGTVALTRNLPTPGNGLVQYGTVIKIQDTLNGAGNKFMWLKDKGAFRAGNYFSDEADIINIANYSFAGGRSNIASGEGSTSFGLFNKSAGQASTTFGESNISFQRGAFTIGSSNKSYEQFSFTSGTSNISRSRDNITVGTALISKSPYSATFGIFNDTTDVLAEFPYTNLRAFQIGNGSGFGRKNALTILYNGNMGLGSSANCYNPAQRLVVEGTLRFITGNQALGKVLTSDANGIADWQSPTGLAAANFGRESYTASSGQTSFTLAVAATAEAEVWRNGSLQWPGTITTSGTTVTFSTALDAGDKIVIKYLHN